MSAATITMRRATTNGVSRTLRAAGHTRYCPGQSGGYRLVDGEYGAEVWDMSATGRPNRPGPQLRAYGLTLTKAGYEVFVAYNEFLLVARPAEATRTERTT